MLIRKPDPKAGMPPEPVDPEHLREALHSGSADDCIRLLCGTEQLPAECRQSALDRLSRESDSRLQQILLNHIVVDLQAEEVEPLIALLSSDDAGLRNQVIDALGQVRQGAVAELLAQAVRQRLHDDDPDIRILTLNLVATLELPQLLPEVEQCLREDAHLNVCMTALDVILMLGNEDHWPAVESLTQRFPDEPFVAFSVRRARSQLRDQD
ncbi:hypothetical protein E4656_09565 [Natronospirillum operosum]|uniref:HEAT repeat domain-containing protein n=1 Tax=Natronospirillum operosum TaxID=2759953 RepID=A0A4Z0WAA3_9GAMM|nr:hypothetical protein [Natronospirillum operosum]TGG93295.1 hypothetical protein E4656_09565 [Natronospirillum operosum]